MLETMRSTLFCWTCTILSIVSSVTALFENGSVIAPCDSPIYCYGDILRQIELARPFSDSKTFVDLPTMRPLSEVIAAFNNLTKPLQNDSALNDFLSNYFGQAGSELEAVPTDQLETQPDFLENINSSTVANFVNQVIDIWPDLTRRYVGSSNCSGCIDSFIPVNRTFVVAGGRFREPYYWDSFWIIEGLLRTKGSFTQIASNIIENFLDFIDTIGFVPNGARVYYLNRSQPPLLTQMIRVYVEQTGNYTILKRALPLLEKEYAFFTNNRSIQITRNSRNYTLNHYAVLNNQPRPESFYEDYSTVNNQSYYNAEGQIFNSTVALNDTEKAQLYANLASGAESGWDYSSRWLKNPNDAITDTYFPLRSLNTVNILPVDLNSILYYNEITIAQFYQRQGNFSAAKQWANLAAARSEAITALLWDEEHYSYFDYNLTAGGRNVYILADNTSTATDTEGAPAGYQVALNAAQFYPFWTGAAPESLKSNSSAIRRVYNRIDLLLDQQAGAISATNLQTGQQWDEPNVWPPLNYIFIQGLLNTPVASEEGTDDDYLWTQGLALKIAQRYLDSTFCTWRVTGGSTPGLPKLQGLSASANGTIFEKYNSTTTNAAGGGGEYTVVEGFGWSNGVLIWAADQFGQQLQTPDCGNITAANIGESAKRSLEQRSAVYLPNTDAKWVKIFKRS